MRKIFFLNILLCFILVWCSSQAIPVDWQQYIADEMLEKYSGKSIDTFYSTSDFQGDITGISRDSDNSASIIMNNAVNDESKRWPDGTVPYVIDEQYLASDRLHELKIIKIAMEQISSSTNECIKFVPRTSQTDYIQIERGLSCSSSIGKQGGKQAIILTVGGCLEEIGSIQHELMHSLGFFHEMSRNDRDDYIWINWDNLQPKYKRDFEKVMDGLTFGLPYDYDSVLQYAWNAFAINNLEPTIVPKKLHARIGQNAGLSILDIFKLQKAYKCPDSTLFFQVAQMDATTKPSTAETEKTTKAIEVMTTVASTSTEFPVEQWNFNKMLLIADDSSRLFQKAANTKEDCNILCRSSKYCLIAGYERSASLCTGYDSSLNGKMVYSEDYVIVGVISEKATRWSGWNFMGQEVLYEGRQIADLAGIIWTEYICTQACNTWPSCGVAVYNLKTSACRMFSSTNGTFSASPDFISLKFSNYSSNRLENNPTPIMELKKRLNKGEKLLPGQSVVSPNGDFEINLNNNGNLEFIRTWDKKILWGSKTTGSNIDYVYCGSNGILGLHDSNLDKYIWTSGSTDRNQEVSYFGVTNEGRFGTFNEAGAIIWAGVLDTPLDSDGEETTTVQSDTYTTGLKIVANRGSFLQSMTAQSDSDCKAACSDKKIPRCYTANFNKKSMLCEGYDDSITAKFIPNDDYEICVGWTSKVTRKNGAVYGGDEVKFHGVQLAEWTEQAASWSMTERVCLLLCHIHSKCRVATFNKVERTCVLKYSGGFVKSDINSSSFVFSY